MKTSTNKTLSRVITGTVAIGVLAGLAVRIDSLDVTPIETALQSVREAKRLESALDVETLRSRLSLNSNYDAVARGTEHVFEMHASLRDSVAPAADSTTSRRLDKYLDVASARLDALERFKGESAILRNSLNYFPTAVETAQSNATAQGEQRVALHVDALHGSLLEFVLKGDSDSLAKVERDLSALEGVLGSLPDTLAADVDELVVHAATVVRRQQTSDRLLSEAVDMPLDAHLDQLASALDARMHGQVEANAFYTKVLIAYAALLLAILAVQGIRLIRSYRALGVANVELADVNAGLEERVVARTGELQEAMDRLKAQQAHLVQSEKMASIGQMVAGVAHEVNTPLGYVKSNFEMVEDVINECDEALQLHEQLLEQLNRESPDEAELERCMTALMSKHEDGPASELLEHSRSLLTDSRYGIDQIQEIVVNLRDFSRLDRAKVDSYDVNEGLSKTLLMARNVLKDGIEVRKDLGELPNVNCAPSQINQVFLNLVTNAAQAMDGNGVLDVATRTEGDEVVVTVTDTGSGMPAEVVDRIFEPFFTTKDVGKGTGLGLSIVYGIVTDHGGDISVQSEPGKGTCFTLRLPFDASAELAEAA